VADLLIEHGVQAILSFSRVRLSRRRRAAIINVDLATEFEKLTYHLSSSERDEDYVEAI
jgi:NADH/NAD ratio-sensing transcriptional regulator Rex